MLLSITPCGKSLKLLPAVLPTLDVHEGALDELLSIYRRLLPGWKGHLVADGHIHKERLEALLNGLAFLEKGMLVKRAAVSSAHTPCIKHDH